MADNSLTGADVNESSLAGLIRGRMLDWNMAAGDLGDPPTPIATVGPYTISGECYSSDGYNMAIDLKGPADYAEAEYSRVDDDVVDRGNYSASATLPANVNTRVVRLTRVGDGGFFRSGGTLVVRSNAGTIVQVSYSAVIDSNAQACHVWGTATTG